MTSSIIRFLGISALLILLTQNCQQEAYQQGKNLYVAYCENCHMADGSGLGANIPPLAQADYLRDNQDKLACIIRNGISEPLMVNGTLYEEPMPGVPQLTEFQIANIINYLNHAWGNDYGFVKVDQLRDQLEKCK